MVVNHWYTIIIHPNHQFVNQGDKENERKGTAKRNFTTHTNSSPHIFWSLMLGIYTGARAEELAQLRIGDIKKSIIENESIYYTDFAVKTIRIFLCLLPLSCLNKGTFIFLPVVPSQGYAAMAALACPGISISGTTMMWRSAA